MVQHEARDVADGFGAQRRTGEFGGTRTDQNEIGLPFRRTLYDFALRPSGTLERLALREVALTLLGDFLRAGRLYLAKLLFA